VEKSISLSIDWIEGTYKHTEARRPMPLILTEDGEECTGFHGYSNAAKYQDGRIEMWHTTRQEMGYHIQWSGEAVRSAPIDGLSLVAYLAATHFTFTRLDLAVDVRGYGFRPQEATEHIKNGDYVCRARKFPQWGDPKNPGYTQYVGKRPSEIYLCIYDKAAELGIGSDHTRIELRCHKGRAQTAAQTILRDNDFRKLVLGYVRFPKWEKWNEVMGTDAVKIPAEKKDSATKEWLLSQCAPALARILDEDGDDNFWFRFIKQVDINRT
jgi:DNA relaxase NicK